MAAQDSFADTFLGRILYSVGGKSAQATGEGLVDWLATYFTGRGKVLDPTEIRRILAKAPPGLLQEAGCTPESIRALASRSKGDLDPVASSIFGTIGVLKGVGTVGDAGPVQVWSQILNYDTRFASPIWLPDPGSIVAAWFKDPDRPCYTTSLRLQGLGQWAQNTLLSAYRQRLTPANYWTLYRRGVIGEEEFQDRYLSMAGLFKDDRARIDALNETLPGLADLWTLYRRGKLTWKQVEDYLWELGYRRDRTGLYLESLRADVPLAARTRLWRYGHIDTRTSRWRLSALGYRAADLDDLVQAAYVLPDLSALISLERRDSIDVATLKDAFRGVGYAPDYVERMAALRYDTPDADTAITWRRRELINDDTLQKLFKAAGLSPDHAGYMRALVDVIPPVPDLVTMAVREAFTPAAVAKFRLHDDFPADFATWAKRQGLTEFWAKAYWAAHWQLPGVREVLDIYHRIDRGTGATLIDDATVDEYLKVADISPYWRPLLRQLSYEPYTRVDVRRMYQVGVVDEKELYYTYRDLGYDHDKATKLTDWTKVEYAKEVTDLTRADILDAYRKGLIGKGKAAQYLDDIGTRPNDALFYLSRTEYLIEQDKKEVTQASLKAMFLQGLISISDIKDRLRKDNYPEGEIARLLNLWETEKEKQVAASKARIVKPTRAELDTFLRAGVIDGPTYEYEMAGLGYSDKYISWFMAAALKGIAE